MVIGRIQCRIKNGNFFLKLYTLWETIVNNFYPSPDFKNVYVNHVWGMCVHLYVYMCVWV